MLPCAAPCTISHRQARAFANSAWGGPSKDFSGYVTDVLHVFAAGGARVVPTRGEVAIAARRSLPPSHNAASRAPLGADVIADRVLLFLVEFMKGPAEAALTLSVDPGEAL